MTTIAIRHGIMAADSSIWEGSLFVGRKQKVLRTSNGTLLATCGYSGMSDPFAEWVNAGEPADNLPRLPPDTDFSALVLYPDEQVFTFDGRFMRQRVKADFYALGSGEAFALGAMHAGASAEDAIKAACEFDAWSRGPVQSERLFWKR